KSEKSQSQGTNQVRVEVIIVGAGKGVRFGEVRPKQFSYLCKKPIFCWTIERFEKCELIDKIILVIPPRMKEYVQKSILSYSDYKKIKATVEGGKERGDSVFQGPQTYVFTSLCSKGTNSSFFPVKVL
ncbi:unnamed protein product, partial [marine sediment metagenome]